MNKQSGFEFIYQVVALIVSIIIVHAVYVAVIRPKANAHLEKERQALAADPEYISQRNGFVLIRDYEQEACFILLFWALAIMGLKSAHTMKERGMLQQNLIQLAEGQRILPEDSRDLSRTLEALPDKQRRSLLPRALLAALHRFDSARNIQDVASAAHSICEQEGERLESELSMIRYIAWAIPSVGFIGTVRGIGDALGKANKAILQTLVTALDVRARDIDLVSGTTNPEKTVFIRGLDVSVAQAKFAMFDD